MMSVLLCDLILEVQSSTNFIPSQNRWANVEEWGWPLIRETSMYTALPEESILNSSFLPGKVITGNINIVTFWDSRDTDLKMRKGAEFSVFQWQSMFRQRNSSGRAFSVQKQVSSAKAVLNVEMDGSGTMIKLTNNNSQIWKSKMEDLLYCKDLYEPVEGDSAKPEGMSESDWTKCNRKAVGTIRQWLDDSVYHHVASETSAHKLWKKLESLYEQKTAANKTFLIRKLVNLKFREGTSVAEHLNEFQSLINQLSAMKMTLEDELQALLLLGSLPDSWETLVVTISNAAPNGVVSNEGKNQKNDDDNKKTAVVLSTNEVVILSCEENQCLHVEGHQGVKWIVDTGACYHATQRREFFTAYKAGDFGTVKMGNTSHSTIVGIGDICLQTDVGCRLTLKDVRHIPDLRLNLISGDALDKDGFKHYLGGGIWKLSKGSMDVAKGKSWYSLYRTYMKVLKNGLNAVQTETSPNL
ncbi:Retrovirus-related Pol polyprotein from transposon TNT 1-94-like protein [Drosera capensis]